MSFRFISGRRAAAVRSNPFTRIASANSGLGRQAAVILAASGLAFTGSVAANAGGAAPAQPAKAPAAAPAAASQVQAPLTAASSVKIDFERPAVKSAPAPVVAAPVVEKPVAKKAAAPVAALVATPAKAAAAPAAPAPKVIQPCVDVDPPQPNGPWRTLRRGGARLESSTRAPPATGSWAGSCWSADAPPPTWWSGWKRRTRLPSRPGASCSISATFSSRRRCSPSVSGPRCAFEQRPRLSQRLLLPSSSWSASAATWTPSPATSSASRCPPPSGGPSSTPSSSGSTSSAWRRRSLLGPHLPGGPSPSSWCSGPERSPSWTSRPRPSTPSAAGSPKVSAESSSPSPSRSGSTWQSRNSRSPRKSPTTRAETSRGAPSTACSP